jgi:hypothetical protein
VPAGEEVLVVVGGGTLLALLVEGARIGELIVGLEDGIGPLLILPSGGDCMVELVTDAIVSGLEGLTMEAPLITDISTGVVEVVVVVTVLVFDPSVDVAIVELAARLIVE